MKLVLKEKELCPHRNRCIYNRQDECVGARPNRNNVFTCDFFDDQGKIEEGHCRLPQDVTGKMQVLID